jgi:type 1 glutamine amidotransferase
MRPRLIFLVGGPDYHPVNEQANLIIDLLGPEYACHTAESLAAFEHLNECDLLVLMGMHWTGWEGRYRSPSETHRRAFEKYVYSGRPLLSAHGGIASYDDWPRFAELVGFQWVFGSSSHSIIAEHQVHIRRTGHPIVEGVQDFSLVDELYGGLQYTNGLNIQVHADASWDGQKHPMVLTAEGGRINGSGKTAYLANGHDMRAFESPALKQLWINAVRWCLAEE